MDIIEKLLVVVIAIVLILIIITPVIISPVNNEPKLELTFEEKKEEAYFYCVEKATRNRDSDLLNACEKVLNINK